MSLHDPFLSRVYQGQTANAKLRLREVTAERIARLVGAYFRKRYPVFACGGHEVMSLAIC